MSWFIIAIVVAQIVNTIVILARDSRSEAQVIAMRAQLSELPVLRSTVAAALSNTAAYADAIDKLRAQQSSLGHDVTAQRMAIQALVVKLTERPERQRFAPPPSSSGVRTKSHVHFAADPGGKTACDEPADKIAVGFDGRCGPVGITSDVEKVTCPKCSSALDNGETTVVSRVAS